MAYEDEYSEEEQVFSEKAKQERESAEPSTQALTEDRPPTESSENVQSGGTAPTPMPQAEVEPLTPSAAPPSAEMEQGGVPEAQAQGQDLSGEDTSALDQLEDIFRQIGGGASDAAENIANAAKETVFGETRDEWGNIVKTFEFDDFGEPQTTAGEVTRTVSEFLIPFIVTSGVVGAAAKSFQFLNFLRSGGTFRNSVLQGGIAGAVVDYAALDPADGNLSTALNEYPALDPYIPEFFNHEVDDTQFEKRLKNVVEGFAIGAAAETIVQGVRVSRASRKVKAFQKEFGTDEQVTEYSRKLVSNLVQSRRTFYNVEQVKEAIDNLGVNDPGFNEALTYLESLERVGRKADEGAASLDGVDAPLSPDTPGIEQIESEVLGSYKGEYDEALEILERKSNNRAGPFDFDRSRARYEEHDAMIGAKDSDLGASMTEDEWVRREFMEHVRLSEEDIAQDLHFRALQDVANRKGLDFKPSGPAAPRPEASTGLDPEYAKLSPEAKAFVDSSETFAGQYDMGRKQALETHYNALGKDSVQAQSALDELEKYGGERGKALAEQIRVLRSGNMEDYMRQATEHLEDTEAAFDRLIDPKGKAERILGPRVVKALQEQADAAYPRGYTNKVSKSFDEGEIRSGIRAVDTKDPLWEGKRPENARDLKGQLSADELKQFSKVLTDGDIDKVEEFLKGVTREGKPAGFDSIFRHYEDMGAAQLLDEFQTMLNSLDGADADLFRTQSLKSVNLEAKNLAKKTVIEIEKDFEDVATTMGASKKALRSMINIDPDDPMSAYQQLAVKSQAMRIVQQHVVRSLNLMGPKGVRSNRDTARGKLMVQELKEIAEGSRRLIRESARATRSNALKVDRIYEEIVSEMGGMDRVDDWLDMVSAAGGGGSATDKDALRQTLLFIRKTDWRMRKEAVVQFWLGAILSAPPTQMINIASNTVASLWFQTEQVVGAMAPRNMPRSFAEASQELSDIAERVADELSAFGAIRKGLRAAFQFNKLAKDKLWKAYQDGDFQRMSEEMSRPENEELGYFWSALFSGKPQMDAATKFDLQPENAISMDKLFPDMSQSSTMGKSMSASLAMLNAIPSASFRMLMAGDAAAKSINYHMKATVSARKLARKRLQLAKSKGLDDPTLPDDTLGKFTVQDADKFAKTLSDNSYHWDSDEFVSDESMTDALKTVHDEATKYSQYATFTEPQEFNRLSRYLQSQTQVTPELKFALPFINTPTNLIKATAERTPFAYKWLGKWKEAVKNNDVEEIHAIKARVRVGSMLWLTAGSLAIDGRITGGAPRDPEERERWHLRKIPEYSIWFKIPYENLPKGAQKWWVRDEKDPSISWFTYGRLEPLSTIFKMSADMTESLEDIRHGDMNDIAFTGVSAIADNILSQSYFEGINRIMSIFIDPERTSAGEELENLAASFVPNILMTGRKTWSDPGMKEARTLYEKIINRTPMSSRLINKTNFFNEDREYPRGWGNFINPFYSGDWVRDPVAEALDEAKVSVNQKRVFGDLGDNIALSPDDMKLYKTVANTLKIHGKTMKEALHLVIQSTEFKNAGPTSEGVRGGKYELLTKVISQYLDSASDVMKRKSNIHYRRNLQRLIERGQGENTANVPGDIMRLLKDEAREIDSGAHNEI